MCESAISVKSLSKEYKNQGEGRRLAVDDISFEVKEGELFAFLGENGAGKSTTINILSTVLEKTSGEAELFGYKIGKDDNKIRDSIGIVFQSSVLDDKLTVKENLLTRGAYYGYSKKEVMKRLEKFMDVFELKEIWNSRFNRLSGGQRRRIDIVRALINRPRLLFLDEPTTGLDPMSRKLVWDYINYLRREEKLTIFLTTHYMEETRDADHVVILEKGKIIAEGTPGELKSSYAKSRLVWYTGENPANDELLAGYEFVYDADHYNVSFSGDELGGITEFVYRNNLRITDYEIIKGTMDDVFLNLTGKVAGGSNE